MSGCSWVSSINPFSDPPPKPASLQSFTQQASLNIRWRAKVSAAENGYVFYPAIVGETVIAAGYKGDVARFENGKVLWKTGLDAKLSAGVGADDNIVAVATVDGELVILDTATGHERWRKNLEKEVLAPPLVAGTMVVVRSSDNTLEAFDADNGKSEWVYARTVPSLALRASTGMIAEGNSIITGFPGGKLVAISKDSGAAIWEFNISSPRGVTELERMADVAGTAVIGRHEVCAAAFQGRVACYDLSSGTAIWSRNISSSVGVNRDIRFLVITDTADKVHCLDIFSGNNVWVQDQLKNRRVSRPLLAGDYVAVGDLEGYVHLINRENGQFVARTRTDSSAIMADPMLIGYDNILVQTQDGGIYVLGVRSDAS